MVKPIDLVIFGAQGDLAGRKLFPALWHLDSCDLLEDDIRILALAREPATTEAFLLDLRDSLLKYVDPERWSEELWARFAQRCQYIAIDFSNAADFETLREGLSEQRQPIFYFATPPSLFEVICTNLGNAQCLFNEPRVVLEKPIGRDLASSREVNETVARFFPERNTYRIDHYLGKETVQNLLVMRFANRFINAQWDSSCIDHVQITVAETVGIEGRWSYYDQVGQLRDMVQNHLMQLVCLVAMEPPNTMTAEDIRDEKIKIVRALRAIDESNVAESVVRGQYTAGWRQGQELLGYQDEPGAGEQASDTETFVAVKAYIDNWRWAGVPFYLRTGKRMSDKVTEIVISYKSLPHNIFSAGENIPNKLVIRLQPDEGIEMHMVSKLHSLKNRMTLARQTLQLDFLNSSSMERIPDAYERLFLDVIRGDQSLFVGREEVEESWRWCDTLIEAWRTQGVEVKGYRAGSNGPTRAELLIENDGRSWHES